MPLTFFSPLDDNRLYLYFDCGTPDPTKAGANAIVPRRRSARRSDIVCAGGSKGGKVCACAGADACNDYGFAARARFRNAVEN